MSVKVILNPYSNRWNAEKRWPQAEAALRAAGVLFDLSVSAGRGDITRLAEQAVQDGYTTIIAAGGDGTIGETVNGMLKAAPPGQPLPVLGFLPLGTANDLGYALKIPLGLEEAAQVIAKGNIQPMDLGQVNDVYFANNTALGLEPYVTVIQERITWIKGIARYLVAALMAIGDRPEWTAQLEWEGGSYEGPLSLIYIGNGPRSGGVFYMGPHADPFDGKLTVVFGHRKTRMAMLATMPQTMKPGAGSYVESPGMTELHTSWLKVRLQNPSPAHADGELFSRAITELEYKIHPGRLRVLLP